MDANQQHLRDLLRTHQSRLRVLELQAAVFGVHTPPHIITEMQQITSAIADLDAQLSQPAPAVSRAALRQLRQQALAAYYAQQWERAEDLFVQVVQADSADQDAQAKLVHTQRQLDLHAFYQAICDLRDAGNARAVLAALDDLQQRQPDYHGAAELREWAENYPKVYLARLRTARGLEDDDLDDLPEMPVRQSRSGEWRENDGLFGTPSKHPWRFALLAAMALALILLASNGNRRPLFQLPTSPTATPGLAQLRVVNTGGSGLNLRPVPNANNAPIKMLPEGTIVAIIGPDANEGQFTWKHVRDPEGAEGWVGSSFLQPVP